MTRPTARAPDPDRQAVVRAWFRLCSLEQRISDDRRLLIRQLEAWRAANDDAPAAFYAADDGDGYRRLVAGGREVPPERLQAPSAEGWHGIPLPSGLFLTKANGVEGPPDDQLLLLAAAARIADLKAQLQAHHFQARFRGVEVEALYDVGLAIASTLDLDALAEEVLLRAVSLLDARRGVLYLIGDDGYALHSHFGGGAVRDAIGTDDEEIRVLLDGGEEPGTVMPGASHALAVPIEVEEGPCGLVIVADKESRHGVGPFPVTDRRTLALFANQAAIALENAKLHRLALDKERLEREMELAAEIQQELLPVEVPTIEGYEVLGWNRPARQIGGDYFDIRPLGEHRWSLVVGDVTGKGMPAALLVSTLHSALRLLPDNLPVGPTLLERLNRHIFESSSSNKFITLLFAELDIEKHEVRFLNAGHNPGVLLREDGTVDELGSGGLPLGLIPGASCEVHALPVARGDLLCLYSDGITECATPDEEEYGLDRLKAFLTEHRRAPLADIIAGLDDETSTFARGEPQGDDQTVVLLRRR